MAVGAGRAGDQGVVFQTGSWCQSVWIECCGFWITASSRLWDQSRRLKGAFLIAGKAGSHKQGRAYFNP